jgi:hypothetical protein
MCSLKIECCFLVWISILLALSISVFLVMMFGVFGYYEDKENCVVTNCTAQTIFYQGSVTPISYVSMQLNKPQDSILVNNNYYDLNSCQNIPDVVSCWYSSQTVSRWQTVQTIVPTQPMNYLWLLCLLPFALLAGGSLLCFFDGTKGSCPCRCACSGRQCNISLIVVGAASILVVVTFVVLGSVGLYNNVKGTCQTACTMSDAINDSSQLVNATEITINITYFDVSYQIHTLQSTYFDFTYKNCQDVPSTLTCYYTPADLCPSVDVKLIPYPFYCIGLIAIVFSILCIVFGWCDIAHAGD